MKAARIFAPVFAAAVCAVSLAARASAQSSLHVEVFRMSMEDWNRVPLELRNDHRKLHEKCRSLIGGGRVERIDRSGGAVSLDSRAVFRSGASISYATSFGMRDRALNPQSMEIRHTGSSMECEPSAVGSRMVYALTHLTGWRPMLGDGAHDDVKRSELPVFDTMRISGSIECSTAGGPRLWAVAPLPVGGERSTQLALAFVLAGGNEIGSTAPGKDAQMEVVLLRGPAGGNDDPTEQIQSLLARPASVLANVLLTLQAGRKSVVESQTEWIYPTDASLEDGIVVPTSFDRLNQGTELQVEYRQYKAGVASLMCVLQHDLQNPVLPLASSRGDRHLKPEKPVSYRITLNERLELSAGKWLRVKEVPLTPIFDGTSDAATNDSCHVFARMISR